MPLGDTELATRALRQPDASRYPVQLEVAGPLAMFARPDTGGTPTSYPSPTWSAVKGMFESIAMFADGRAWICPTRVEVCRRIGEPGGVVRFTSYTTNYGGPERKLSLMGKGTTAGGSSFQLRATVLSDVCYRLHGIVVGDAAARGTNPRHHLKDLFDRRVRRGQSYSTPRLGWSEFTCSYAGPFRDAITEVDDAMNMTIPSMLLAVWNRPVNGSYSPRFQQDALIQAGALEYEIPASWLAGEAPEGGPAHAE